jgi:hypothetical protein
MLRKLAAFVPLLVLHAGLALALEAGDILILDASARAVLLWRGGELTELSGPGRGSGPSFVEPRAVDFGPNFQAWVADPAVGIVRIDPETGDREVVAAATAERIPLALVFDQEGRLFSLDTGASAQGIYEVDMDGERSVTLDLGFGATPNFLGVRLFKGHRRLMVSLTDAPDPSPLPPIDDYFEVLWREPGIYGVTGDAEAAGYMTVQRVPMPGIVSLGTTISGSFRFGGIVGDGPPFGMPRGIDVIFATRTVLVADISPPSRILSVDRASGDRSVLLQGDGQWVDVRFLNPFELADADSDSVRDDLDNCPGIFNPDQLDDDADGVGNACDTDVLIELLDACTAERDQLADDLSEALADLDAVERELQMCLDSSEDADGDSVPDATDSCPGTLPMARVDADGCSRSQFCAGFRMELQTERIACLRADWRADEPGRGARDCRPRREDGRFVCVPR